MNYRKIISVGDGRDAFTHLFEQSSFAAKYILEFFYSRIKPRTGQMIFENTGFFVTAKSLPKISLAWMPVPLVKSHSPPTHGSSTCFFKSRLNSFDEYMPRVEVLGRSSMIWMYLVGMYSRNSGTRTRTVASPRSPSL